MIRLITVFPFAWIATRIWERQIRIMSQGNIILKQNYECIEIGGISSVLPRKML